MNMQFLHDKMMPGQTSKLLTKATEGSFVSLLGVDQSVNLLGHGNDIDRTRVSADLKLYDSSTYAQEEDTNSKYSDFSESNAFIITDAMLGEKKCELGDRADLMYSTDGSPPPDFEDDDDAIVPDASKKRTVFPETWIFKDFRIGKEGKFLLKPVVPDTITSFIVTGFAVHPEHGLAVALPKKITVFKEFFVKLFVPYSVRLGEVMKVDVSVFNYLSADKRQIQATVSLKGQTEFEFVDVDMKTCTFTSSRSNRDQSKTISVPYDNAAATYFLIRAKKIGLMTLSVHATTTASQVTDTFEKSVKVDREGYREADNKVHIVDLRGKNFTSLDFQISFPGTFIGDSVQISASVIGDLLGPALVNIHSLM